MTVAAEQTQFYWTPALIKDLRGNRSLFEFAARLGVTKNTVWRWEAGYVKPDAASREKLDEVAASEQFLADWRVVGSIVEIGDLEKADQQLKQIIRRSLLRSVQRLGAE
jgi:transcriptional regulator with XRE-family HTH domain